jgi:hypothetical protein
MPKASGAIMQQQQQQSQMALHDDVSLFFAFALITKKKSFHETISKIDWRTEFIVIE